MHFRPFSGDFGLQGSQGYEQELLPEKWRPVGLHWARTCSQYSARHVCPWLCPSGPVPSSRLSEVQRLSAMGGTNSYPQENSPTIISSISFTGLICRVPWTALNIPSVSRRLQCLITCFSTSSFLFLRIIEPLFYLRLLLWPAKVVFLFIS